MCECKIKSKTPAGSLGNYNYVFECEKADGTIQEIEVSSSNDIQAKALAELECDTLKIIDIERLKAYPNTKYKEYMVVSFKTDKNGVTLYWAGLFEGGNQESAFQKGENNIIKAIPPIYDWGTKNNWQITSTEAEINPLEIYKKLQIVKI